MTFKDLYYINSYYLQYTQAQPLAEELFSQQLRLRDSSRADTFIKDKGSKQRERLWHGPGIPDHFSMGGVD